MAQHPLAHVAQIDGPPSQDRVVKFLHLTYPSVNDLLPGPGGTVPLINKSNHLHNERRIIEKFSMHTENGRFASTKACFDLLMQSVKLCLCSIQCVLQSIAFRKRVAGMIFDDKAGLLLVLMNWTNSQATSSWHASKSCACCLWCPALSPARRCRGKLFFRLISKSTGNGLLQGVECGLGVGSFCRHTNGQIGRASC